VGPSNPRRREVPCTFVGRCIEATSNTSSTPSRLESTSKPRLSPASGILWPACLAPPAAQSPDGSRPAAAKADTYPHFWKKKIVLFAGFEPILQRLVISKCYCTMYVHVFLCRPVECFYRFILRGVQFKKVNPKSAIVSITSNLLTYVWSIKYR